jgi:hypothetical protein
VSTLTLDLTTLSFKLEWSGQRLHYECRACGQKSPTYQFHLLHKQAFCSTPQG